MTRTTYEIHVRGQLPARLATALGDATAVAAPPETVLLTPLIDQAGLHEMLARLRDFGIELVEIRQDCGGWFRGSSGARMTHQAQRSDLATYEVRVHGLLGPLLLSALPHVAAQPVPRHTLLVSDGSNGRDLVEITRLIVANGLEVVSVRAARGPTSVPDADPDSACAASPQPSHPSATRCAAVVD